MEFVETKLKSLLDDKAKKALAVLALLKPEEENFERQAALPYANTDITNSNTFVRRRNIASTLSTKLFMKKKKLV